MDLNLGSPWQTKVVIFSCSPTVTVEIPKDATIESLTQQARKGWEFSRAEIRCNPLSIGGYYTLTKRGARKLHLVKFSEDASMLTLKMAEEQLGLQMAVMEELLALQIALETTELSLSLPIIAPGAGVSTKWSNEVSFVLPDIYEHAAYRIAPQQPRARKTELSFRTGTGRPWESFLFSEK